jgi:hypothetical protein
MTAEAPIVVLGRALYGPHWQSPLARDLGLSVSTVADWARGVNAPRAATRKRLLAHARRLMRRADADAEAIRAALERFEASEPPRDGRAPKLSGAELAEAARLWADQTMSGAEVARRVGLDRTNLYKALGPRSR